MELEKIRQKIDQIDAQMKELFLQRMDCSRQVAEAKRENGTNVYVPEREAEILKERTAGVEEEKLPEYQAFLLEIMRVSRTYQYSLLAEEGAGQYSETESFKKWLPQEKGRIRLEFLCPNRQDLFVAVLDGLQMAGLSVEEICEKSRSEKGICYSMILDGDFSGKLVKGALFQVKKEMEMTRFEKL